MCFLQGPRLASLASLSKLRAGKPGLAGLLEWEGVRSS